MTRYITIRSDSNYSELRSSLPLIDFLDGLGWSCGGTHGSWRDVVVLAMASPEGNYRTNGSHPPEFNVVEIICYQAHSFEAHEALARKIAGFLGWCAYDDHDNRQIRGMKAHPRNPLGGGN